MPRKEIERYRPRPRPPRGSLDAAQIVSEVMVPAAGGGAEPRRDAATDEPGRFVERPVRLGGGTSRTVEIVEGVKAGERVVTEGSFYLRAEAGRARGGV